MKNWLGIALLGLALGALSGCEKADDRLVFALKPDKDPDRMIAEKTRMEEFLSERLGRPVSAIIPTSGAIILEGFANGTIDAGYVNATELVYAREEHTASLLLAGEIDGNPYYSSYWVSLEDKPYDSVEDLEGKRVAFSSRVSTSGFVIPFWDLHQKGLLETDERPEDFFGSGNVWYGSGYVSAIERVLEGDAEAAAVSYYVLDEDRHLSDEQRARLKKVTEQGPVPTHVIAVRKELVEADRTALRRALLELNDEENHQLRDRLFTSRLVEVDEDEHVAGLAEAMSLVRQLTP